MKCSECVWMETFTPRLGEPSGFGCKKPGWEGYLFVKDGEPHDPHLPVGACTFGMKKDRSEVKP